MKIERQADTLPRQMHGIMFKKPHPFAGQVVRVGREAAIYFNVDEAHIRRHGLIQDGKIPEQTEVVTLYVKERRAMLKPEARPGRD